MRRISLLNVAGFALTLLCLALTLLIVNEIIRTFQATNAWQPWVTGAGVIVAVAVSIWQQAKIDGREIAQRERKGVAARSVMPAALAEICEYAEQCAASVKAGYPSEGGVTMLAGPLPVPKFPSDALKTLRDCVEYADADAITSISKLISRLQVQHSRITPFFQRSSYKSITDHEYDKQLSDIIYLHANCSSLFPYARFEEKPSEPRTHDQLIRASASSCDIYDYKFPNVFKYMELLGPIV
jgi:hypothetical protein